jgi:hypothetical protein
MTAGNILGRKFRMTDVQIDNRLKYNFCGSKTIIRRRKYAQADDAL